MGVTVNSFTKDPAVYEITLTVRGRVEERKEILDKITDAFERDVANLSPGRIYYGEYYIDCYIYKSSNEVSDKNNSRTDCKKSIVHIRSGVRKKKEVSFRFRQNLKYPPII